MKINSLNKIYGKAHNTSHFAQQFVYEALREC